MSFDSYASATSSRGTTPAGIQSEAYVKALEAQVDALRVALAEEQEKTRRLEEVNAMLEANVQPLSISSISFNTGSSGGTLSDGSIRARNQDLQHLHQDVLRVQDAIINYASGFSLFRDSYLGSDELGRAISAQAMAAIIASTLGKRPGWLIGQSSLGVIVKLYEDHVVHDLLANLPSEVAELYDSKHREDTKEALSFYLINTRYSMTTKCKKAMRQIFGYLNLPDGIFVSGLEPRRQSSKVAALLGRGPNSTAISQRPPLIYGTLPGERLEIPFASKAIENVIQVIMYGGNSFNNAEGEWPKNASAYKWGLSSVTPGTIAFAAIMAIYLLSGDKELSNTGDYSKFDYRSCFMVFVGSLWTSWTGGATARLVAHLNEKFYVNLPNYPDATSTSLSVTAAGSSTIEHSQNLLADLQDSDAPLGPEPTQSAGSASPAQSPPPSLILEGSMTPADAHELPLPPLIDIVQETDASSAIEPCDATDSGEDAGVANEKGRDTAGGGQRRASARPTGDVTTNGMDSGVSEGQGAKGAGKAGQKGKKGGAGSSSKGKRNSAATQQAPVEPRATRSKARK